MLAPIPMFSKRNQPAVGAIVSDVVENLLQDVKLKSKFPPIIKAPWLICAIAPLVAIPSKADKNNFLYCSILRIS